MKREKIVAVGCGLILSFLFGFIQKPLPDEFRRRGNRREGIKKIWEIGGADLEFMGAYIDAVDFPPIDSLSTLQLKFYLPERAAMQIQARDRLGKNYWMMPQNQTWKKGWNMFEWPTEVLQKIPLQVYELIPADSARVGRSSGPVAPFLLTSAGLRLQRQKYVFIFEASGQAEINVRWMKKAPQQEVEIARYNIKQPAKTPFPVAREFKTEEDEGEYGVKLRGRIIRGSDVVIIKCDYNFYHKSIF